MSFRGDVLGKGCRGRELASRVREMKMHTWEAVGSWCSWSAQGGPDLSLIDEPRLIFGQKGEKSKSDEDQPLANTKRTLVETSGNLTSRI